MLGDELDIYDDLDDFQEAEEKKSKELQAWESKYESAQVEISTLEEHNKSLEKKVRIMEVNFQNLLDTAKAEIKRKDALITKLRKEKDDICFRRKKPERFVLDDGKPKFSINDQDYNRVISEKTVEDKSTIASQGISKAQFCHKGIKEGNKTCPKSEQNVEQEPSIKNISGKRSSVERKTQRNGCTERMYARDRVENTVDRRKEDQEQMHNREKREGVGDRKDKEHVRGRAGDRKNNNDADWVRERSNKYRDRAEDHIKGHRDHRAHSRKTDENIASREKKEQKHNQSKDHNEKCERSVDEKQKDHERKRSRERSRRHTNRSRQLEEKSSHRENRITEDLKISCKSRSRSPLEKNYTNSNTSERYKWPIDEKRNKEKTRDLPSDTRSRRCSPKKMTTEDSNSADSIATKEFHKLMDNAEQSKPMDVVTPLSCTENEIKSTVEEAASTSEQNTVGIDIEKNTICETFEHIPGLDLIVKKDRMEKGSENTHVPDKSMDETHIVETPEPHLKDIQNVLKETDQIPGLDLIEDAGATEPDLKDFHHISERFEPSPNVNNVADLEAASLDEKLVTQAKLTDLPNNLQTTEITELQKVDKATVAQVNEVVSKESTIQDKSIENIHVKETEINTNAARTNIITVISAESELKNVKITNDRKGANPFEVSNANSRNAVKLSKANTRIEEIKEFIAGDADRKESTNSVRDTINEFVSNDSEHCTAVQTKRETDYFENIEAFSEKNISTPNPPITPHAQKLAESFQYVKVDSEDNTPTPKRATPSPTQKATEFLQNKEAHLEDHILTLDSPARSSKDIQIIEDIRLPVMVDIEHIAVSVDKLNESHDKDKLVQPEKTILRKEPDAVVENRRLDEESTGQSVSIMKPNRKESATDSNNAIITTTDSILYVQPDSTKIDHNDDETETAVNANMEILTTPEKLMADNLNASYPNLKLEFDNIEMALERLHQRSQTGIQPDEDTVTSTSMKAPKDLIKILMQSPVHKGTAAIASKSPILSKSSSKKIGARTVSERKKSTSLTPKRLVKTPVKKIKISPTHDEQTVFQTPTKRVNSHESEDITIDETIDESSQVEHPILGIGETSIVTKRCSLGNRDYQFEKVNDQVVLRITRRGRRRAAPTLSVHEI